MMAVELSTLKLGSRLGTGGQAEVFRLDNYPQSAFKRYRAQLLPKLRTDVLDGLVAETPNLKLEGRPITYWATWPTATVRQNGHVVGFMMPLIPADFSFTEGQLKGIQSSFMYLASKPAPFWGAVTLPAVSVRVHLLALLAGVVQQLHHRNMVVGDISWANMLWTTRPEPRVMLHDCDGIRPPTGVPVSPQLDSPDWDDPLAAPGSAPDQDRDCYKLALAVQRVLGLNLTARPDPAGGHAMDGVDRDTARTIDGLLMRAAGRIGTRPTATEWRQALQGRAAIQVTQPAPAPSIGTAWPPSGPPTPAPTVRQWKPVQQPTHSSPTATPPATPPTVSSAPNSQRRWKPLPPQGS